MITRDTAPVEYKGALRLTPIGIACYEPTQMRAREGGLRDALIPAIAASINGVRGPYQRVGCACRLRLVALTDINKLHCR
jgi:hypothetical protein